MRKVFTVVAAVMVLVVALAGSALANDDGFPNQGDPDKVYCFDDSGQVDCTSMASMCEPATMKYEPYGQRTSLYVPADFDAVSIKSGAKACDFKGETCSVEYKGCGNFEVHLLQAISNYVKWTCEVDGWQ